MLLKTLKAIGYSFSKSEEYSRVSKVQKGWVPIGQLIMTFL